MSRLGQDQGGRTGEPRECTVHADPWYRRPMAIAVRRIENPFAAIFESLGKLFATSVDAPAAQKHLGEYTCTAVDRLYAAEDCEHLLALLDDLSSDGAFWDDVGKAAERAVKLTGATTDLAKVKLDVRSLNGVIGTTATATCERGFQALKKFDEDWSIFAKKLRIEENDTKPEAPPSQPMSSMVAMLYDRAMPFAARRVIAKILISFTSIIVIARAEELGLKLDPWLGLALAETFARPIVDSLAMLQSDITAEDIDALVMDSVKEQLQFTATYESWRAQAELSGDDVYFPLEHATR